MKRNADTLWTSFLVIVVTLVLYGPTLFFDFAYDDSLQILDNPQVAGAPFTWGSFARIMTEPTPGVFYRPVGTLSYWLTYAAFGADPLWFHVTNVVLFAVCCILVIRVCERFTRSTSIGIWAGFLFAVHPIHVEAVANVIGRIEILACTFSLASILAMLESNVAGSNKKLLRFLSAAFLLLGMLSKESAATTLAILPFCMGIPWRRPLGRVELKGVFAGMVLPLSAVGVAIVARFAVLGDQFFKRSTAGLQVYWENPLVHLSGVDRTLGAVKTLGEYIFKLLFPLNLSADYSMMPADFRTDLYSMEGGSLIVLVIAFVVMTVKYRHSFEGLFLFWFFASISVTSNIFIMNSTIMGDRLAFLPSVGMVAFIAVALSRVHAASPKVILSIVAIGLLLRAGIRVPVWRDNETLFMQTLRDAEDSPKALYNAGIFLLDVKRDGQSAKVYFEAVLKYFPTHILSLMCLGDIASAQGNFELMESYYRQVLEIDPSHPAVRRELDRYLDYKRRTAAEAAL